MGRCGPSRTESVAVAGAIVAAACAVLVAQPQLPCWSTLTGTACADSGCEYDPYGQCPDDLLENGACHMAVQAASGLTEAGDSTLGPCRWITMVLEGEDCVASGPERRWNCSHNTATGETCPSSPPGGGET
jgi:hypothetical protein